MARRGTFGKAPRAVPSLTATLISIAREQIRQEDQNIMSAWKSGGLYEGAPVTDDMVLAHWNKRLEGISKDDPLYDVYNQAVTQYTYAIAESKASTLYAQKKLTDTQMAQFYLNWAKHPGIPKDSEFYRVLQRDAAQFMRSAASQSNARAKAAAEKAYGDQMSALQKRNEAPGEYLFGILTDLAQAGNASLGIGTLVGAQGSNGDLTNFDPNDPDQMLKLIGTLNSTVTTKDRGEDPNQNVLYHQSNGTSVTAADVQAEMKKLDPTFSGTFNVAYLGDLFDGQLVGLQKRIDLAKKTGHVQDANNLQKSYNYVSTVTREVKAWPVQKDYANARRAFDNVTLDPMATPAAIQSAWATYQGTLFALADDPRISDNDAVRSALTGEASMTVGTRTMAESFTQLSDPTSASNTDVEKRKIKLDQATADQQALDSGYGVLTQGVNTSTGFEPRIGGSALGVATQDQILALGGSVNSIFMPTVGGAAANIVVVSAPVKVTGKDFDGNPIEIRNDQKPAAEVLTIMMGGQRVEIFAFKNTAGQTIYSASPPWNSRFTAKRSGGPGGGYVVDISDALSIPGVQGISDEGSDKVSHLVADQSLVLSSSDPARNHGGYDPSTDFFSPTLAFLSATPAGVKLYEQYGKDPNSALHKQIVKDAYLAAGYVEDNKLGWVPPVGHEREASLRLGSNLGQMTLIGAAEDDSEVRRIGYIMRDRGPESLRPQFTGQLVGTEGKSLPLDAVRNTPFGSLADSTHDGTNILAQHFGLKPGSNGTQIKVATNLTLPGLGSTSIAPNTTAGPTSLAPAAATRVNIGGTGTQPSSGTKATSTTVGKAATTSVGGAAWAGGEKV